jgi:hypothetical protein
MGYFKVKVAKDNTINSFYDDSNQGESSMMEIFSRSLNLNDPRQLSRALIQFDLSDLNLAISSGLFSLTSNTTSAYLKVYHAHTNILPPQSVIYNVHPISSSWQEGKGFDLTTTGYSNWNYRDSLNNWTTSGGDYGISLTSLSADFGDENIVFDIKSQLISWTTGTNYGIIIKLSDEFESSTGSLTANDYYAKKIFGKNTKTIFEPRIDILYQNKFSDDFNNLYFGSGGSIYFYNKNNGAYTDLNGTSGFPGYLSFTGSAASSVLSSSTSIIFSNVPGNRYSTGIYKFDIPNISYTAASLSSIYASWVLTTGLSAVVPSINKSVLINSPIQNNSIETNSQYRISIINFKDRLNYGDSVNYNVFIKKISDQLSSLTAGSTSLSSFIALNGYWKVVDEKTGVDVYPWDSLSYNDSMNFFTLNTEFLYRGRPYRLIIKFIEGEYEYIFDSPDYYYTFYLY